MKKTGFLIVLAAVALLGAGCQQGGKDAGKAKPKLAFITNGVASFWDIAKVGAEKAGADLQADVTVLMPASGVVDQKQMIEDLMIRGVHGVAISPIDPDNQTEILNKAAAAAAMITVDSDAPHAQRLAYLGMDNYAAGRMAGQLVKEALPQGGSVVLFVGRIEQDNAKRRRQGLIDALLDRPSDPNGFDEPGKELANDKYRIVGTLVDQFDRAKAKSNVEDTLTRYADLGCMVGLFAYNPPIILEALERAGKLGKVKVVAFDEADETLRAIANGNAVGTVVQNPYEYGYRSMVLLNQIVRGDRSGIPHSGFIDIPARFVRQADVASFEADLKAKLNQP